MKIQAKGFTLIELLVSMVMFVLVIGGDPDRGTDRA
jgi:prepilin-type N-terminal cleavage/methylation domain-containing protein